MKGIIISQISNFYYVDCGEQIIECKPRGLFRKEEESPRVGDKVEINTTDGKTGAIVSIAPRLNFMIRPPLANIDRLFIIVSTAEPKPNMLIIDKITVSAVNKGIEPIIIINKTDLCEFDQLKEIYHKAGFRVICVSAVQNRGIDDIIPLIKDKVSAFCGNSGVGKSSVLNAIDDKLMLKTSSISHKLGRGKHTTRHCELYKIHGGYVADTPGFSGVEMERFDKIRKDNLQFCFPDFAEYLALCKYTSCSHTKEKGCKIIEAVQKGKIPESRHESYIRLYEEASKYNEWEFGKPI